MKFRVEVGDFGNDVFMSVNALQQATTAAASKAALNEAKRIFFLSQAIVPVDTGQLLLSGRVEDASEEADELLAGILYGGPAGSGENDQDVDYALTVHEDLEAFHPHGEAKFVERPMFEEWSSGRSLARMKAEMQRSIEFSLRAFANKSGMYRRNARGQFQGSTQG